MHATQLVGGEALTTICYEIRNVERNASLRLRLEAAYVEVQAMYWRPSIICAAERLRLEQLTSLSPRTKIVQEDAYKDFVQ